MSPHIHLIVQKGIPTDLLSNVYGDFRGKLADRWGQRPPGFIAHVYLEWKCIVEEEVPSGSVVEAGWK